MIVAWGENNTRKCAGVAPEMNLSNNTIQPWLRNIHQKSQSGMSMLMHQMANSLWSEENSPQLYLFFAHLWQLNFLVKLVTLTLWWRINDTICKQKIVVLWNVAFSANVGELAFCSSKKKKKLRRHFNCTLR